MEVSTVLIATFFCVAAVYSLFGFGGGSSYLAALVIAGYSHSLIPPIALSCNVAVVAVGFYQYAKAGHFRGSKILPFVLLSAPMAYWGGTIPLSKRAFSILLGISLCCVAARMLFTGETKAVSPSGRERWAFGLIAGAAIGFLSGLIGIGGGIFLSPLLLLVRWADEKEAAAAASFFILVNSLAGIAARLRTATLDAGAIWPLVLAVVFGGFLGSRFGARRVPKLMLRRGLALFVFYAAFKLLSTA